MSTLHIADTGLFVAMGQPLNNRYKAIRRFARRNDITFILPERVYEELTVDGPDDEVPPVDAAIDEGWTTVAAPLARSTFRRFMSTKQDNFVIRLLISVGANLECRVDVTG